MAPQEQEVGKGEFKNLKMSNREHVEVCIL